MAFAVHKIVPFLFIFQFVCLCACVFLMLLSHTLGFYVISFVHLFVYMSVCTKKTPCVNTVNKHIHTNTQWSNRKTANEKREVSHVSHTVYHSLG